MANNTNTFNEEVGLLRRGWIDKYDSNSQLLYVKLNNAAITSANQAVVVPAPQVLFNNHGMYVGTLPSPGTPVVVGQGSGGQYYFVSYLAENVNNVPDLTINELLIQANDITKIYLNSDNNDITIGSDADQLHVNTDRHYFSSNIDNEYRFTQASRHITGVVKRDITPNTVYDQNTKLENDNYDPYYYVIPLDPTTTPSNIVAGTAKNPPLVEDREILYEFQYDSNISDDLTESNLYGTTGASSPVYTMPNRRTSRADTMSLTLAAPNYLMETIKGTVVDIFGNILDLNRNAIPIGTGQNTINPSTSTNQVQSFLDIKALERKSVAYHFEINARKDLTGSNGQIALPNITSSADHARNRSRFFFDVDKEGQFKLNVPASSETGNIGLLARYENFSTFTTNDNSNPNQLVTNTDNLDIYLDSFAEPAWTTTSSGFSIATTPGSIAINDSGAPGTPIDRIAQVAINHGTAYHDILQTCYAAQTTNFINYQHGTAANPIVINDTNFPPLTNVVSDTINISGPTANAGGRSGSINFDGSLDFNVGANTVDRQSLWIDTAGGIVGNFGRDLNGRSAVLGFNGDMYMQIGGFGVIGDLRFVNQMNGSRGAVLDLRIVGSGGNSHLIRCDDNGITIMTPGNLQIYATKGMNITSDGQISIEAENVMIQGRSVIKGPITPSI